MFDCDDIDDNIHQAHPDGLDRSSMATRQMAARTSLTAHRAVGVTRTTILELMTQDVQKSMKTF